MEVLFRQFLSDPIFSFLHLSLFSSEEEASFFASLNLVWLYFLTEESAWLYLSCASANRGTLRFGGVGTLAEFLSQLSPASIHFCPLFPSWLRISDALVTNCTFNLSHFKQIRYLEFLPILCAHSHIKLALFYHISVTAETMTMLISSSHPPQIIFSASKIWNLSKTEYEFVFSFSLSNKVKFI